MRLFRTVVYSNIWISFSVAAYLLLSFELLHLRTDWALVAFVFSATLFTYNFQRLVKYSSDFPVVNDKTEWIHRHIQNLKILSIIGGLACVGFGIYLSFESLVTMSLLGIISILYASPFLKTKKSLRDIPAIKIYLIAITWSVTALIPVLNLDISLPFDTWLLMILEKFCFILAITIPFDIRDLNIDDSSKKTIPQLLGVTKAKIIALGLLTIHTCLAIYLYDKDMVLPVFMANSLTGILIYASTTDKDELYFTGVLDASPIWTWLAVLIFS